MWQQAARWRKGGRSYSDICGQLSKPENMQRFGLSEVPSQDTVRREVTMRLARAEGSPGQLDLTGVDTHWVRKHISELFYFGQRLRDRLGLLLPLDAAALDPDEKRLNLWSSDVHAITGAKGWALGNYDARGDLLFASLQQHLAGNPCWTILKQVEDSFHDYQKACARAYRRVREEISKQLPALADPDIEAAMADSLFVNACYRAEGASDIAFSYEPNKTQQGDKVWWYLQLGAWGVGHTEDPAALRPLASVHKELNTALPVAGEFKELIEVKQAAHQATQQFRRDLSPDALLRKLILDGRCDLCP